MDKQRTVQIYLWGVFIGEYETDAETWARKDLAGHSADVAVVYAFPTLLQLPYRVVNVCGGVARNLFEFTSHESHAENIRYNYGYHIDSCQCAIPLLRKSGSGGAIVNFATGSIRGDFATLVGENMVHGSDSPESAEREIGIWFPELSA